MADGRSGGTALALEPIETPAAPRRIRAKRARPRKPGGESGGAQRPPVAAGCGDDAPPVPLDVEEQWWDGDVVSAYVANGLGVDLRDVLALTETPARQAIAAAMKGHVFTKRRHKSALEKKAQLDERGEVIRDDDGEVVVDFPRCDRSVRVLSCGHLRPAYRGTEYGAAHWHCRDRLCPHCAERRAREYASAARPFVESVPGSVLFVTLTQVKRSVAIEGAQGAFDRLMVAWRRMQNPKTKRGRHFRKYFVGGARAVELKFSAKGERKGDHVVAYDGWHPHFHCLLEVAPGTDPAAAMTALSEMWCESSPMSAPVAQNLQLVDERRIGQLCKYPLKLPTFAEVEHVRDAAMTLADRKTLTGFGSWRSFLKSGREIREAMPGVEKKPPVRMAEQRLSALANKTGSVVFQYRGATPTGPGWVTQYREVRLFREALLADPRTFGQRDRDHRLAKKKLADENKQRAREGLPALDLVDDVVSASLETIHWWRRYAPDLYLVRELAAPPPRPPPPKPPPPKPEQLCLRN